MPDSPDTFPPCSPLVESISSVYDRILHLKEGTRQLYFEALLSLYRCPQCAGHLQMAGTSRCICSCGKSFDPTLVFQKSTCCGASLVKKIFHYVCSNCNKTVPSRFIFDERIFDKAYFRDMVQISRERTKRKREELRRLLFKARSGDLPFLEAPSLGKIAGLEQSLDDFIGSEDASGKFDFDVRSEFTMRDYRAHILSALGWGGRLFSSIEMLTENRRLDKVRRFITLIFMQHEREVQLTQLEDDLMIQRAYEAYD